MADDLAARLTAIADRLDIVHDDLHRVSRLLTADGAASVPRPTHAAARHRHGARVPVPHRLHRLSAFGA